MPPKNKSSISRSAAGLPRYYMDCGWYRHPNFAGLPLDALALFEAMIGYSCEHATDGRLPLHPEDMAAALGLRASAVRKALRPLIDSGRVVASGSHVVVVDFTSHNPTADEIDLFIEERSRSGAKGNHIRHHVNRNRWSADCEFCPDSEPIASAQRGVSDGLATTFGRDSDAVLGQTGIAKDAEPEAAALAPTCTNDLNGRRSSDRSSDPTAIANRSHGLGWVGLGSPSIPHAAATDDRAGPAEADASTHPEEDHPPNPERTATLAIEHMARCDLRQAETDGTPIRQPDRWLAKATATRRAAHHDRLLEAATERPDADPVTLAEEIDPACGPDDGGLARAKAEAALSVQAAAADEARRAEYAAWIELADTRLAELDDDQRTQIEAQATETNPTLRRMELRHLVTQERTAS